MPCRPLDPFLLWLGVLCYRWLLVRGPFAAFNKWIHLRSKKGLPELRRHMREAEIERLYRFQSNVGADCFFPLLRDHSFSIYRYVT